MIRKPMPASFKQKSAIFSVEVNFGHLQYSNKICFFMCMRDMSTVLQIFLKTYLSIFGAFVQTQTVF